MRLRYAGRCTRCGDAIAAGEQGWWDRSLRAVTCLNCRDVEGNVIARELGAIGTPGASIQREYERRHGARLRRNGGGLRGFITKHTSDPQSTVAFEEGAAGERAVARRLNELVPEGFAVLHNRRVPNAGGDIDHIVVAPSGIHVIDSKRYSGRVETRIKKSWLRERDIRLYVGGRDRQKLILKITAQVLVLNAAVRDVVSIETTLVTPILCFADADWALFARPIELHGVRIMWPKALVKLLRRPGPLSADEIVTLRDHLAFRLPPA